MPASTGSFSAILTRELRKVYLEVGQERPAEYEQVFNVETMVEKTVKDQQISGLGTLATKAEGARFSLDQPIIGTNKSATAEPFGLAFEITFEMWEDDQYGTMRRMAGQHARASRNKQETEAWSILNQAFNAAVTGFDGKSLCNTAHTTLDGRTVSNRPSTDISLSITAIQNGLFHFHNLTDERNIPSLMHPTMIVIAPENVFTAREILASGGKPFTADNEANALIPEMLRWMVSHYITTSTFWFLLAARGEHDLEFLWRTRPIFDSFDDPWTKNAVFTVYQRHTKRFASWRGVYGSTG